MFHVRHFSKRPTSPLHPDKGGTAIKTVVAPRGGAGYDKDTNSAFIGTDLEADLRKRG